MGLAFVLKATLLLKFNMETTEDGFGNIQVVDSVLKQGYHGQGKYLLHPTLLAGVKVLLPEAFDTSLVGRGISALAGSMAVGLLFLLVSNVFDRKTAILSAVLLFVSPWAVLNDTSTLNASPFLFVYLLFILFYLRKNWLLCSFMSSGACMIRYEGIVLVVFLFITLLNEWRLKRIGSSKAALCIFLNAVGPGTWIMKSYFLSGNLFRFLGTQRTDRFIAEMPFRYGDLPELLFKISYFTAGTYFALTPLVAFLGVIGFGLILKEQWNRNTQTLGLLFLSYTVFYLILGFVDKVNPELRYLLFPGITLIVFAAYALARIGFSLYNGLRLEGLQRRGRLYRMGVMVCFLAILALPIGISAFMGYNITANGYTQNRCQEIIAKELEAINEPGTVKKIVVSRNAGALGMFGFQQGLWVEFIHAFNIPDQGSEKFLIDQGVEYIVYTKDDPRTMRIFPYLNEGSVQEKFGLVFEPITSIVCVESLTSNFSIINRKRERTTIIYAVRKKESS